MDGPRRALIVASDSYTDPGLRQLRAPARDARALEAVLGDPEIGGFEVRTILNEPAHMIMRAIEGLFANCTPGDLLVVYFSCHGIKDVDGRLYFAASDTVLGLLGSTAVGAGFVSDLMNRTRSRVVLFLDCCYAGAFERGLVARAGTDIGIEHHLAGRGRAVITASSAMEYAFEAGELKSTQQVPPSVFTSALVEGLETGDADRDRDGRIGLDELYSYVYDKVRAVTPNQTPGKWILGMEGELYLARRRRQPELPRPVLAVSPTEIDFGSLRQHGRSREQLIRVTNAGGGELNQRATASARWLRLRRTGNELAVTVDTKKAGDYHGTITIDSDCGTATIRVHARVDAAPPPPLDSPAPDDQAALQALPAAEAARQAGPKFELGELLKVHVRYGSTPLSGLRMLLYLLSTPGLMVALGYHAWVLAGLAGAVFAAACVVYVIGRRKRPVQGWLARYQDGYAQLLLPGNLRVVRWAEVTEVGLAFRIGTSGGNKNSPPGTSAAVYGFYAQPCLTQFKPQITRTREAAALAADALRAVSPRLTSALVAAYDAGEAAVFGRVQIDQSGFTLPAGQGWPGGLVPWAGISSVTGRFIVLPGGRRLVFEINLRCESEPKHRSIGLGGVPNAIFLPDVLRHAATQHGISTQL